MKNAGSLVAHHFDISEVNNMAFVESPDENFDDSLSDFSVNLDRTEEYDSQYEASICSDSNESEKDSDPINFNPKKQAFRCTKTVEKETNVVKHVLNRQIYGRFTKNSKAKTEKVFNKVPLKCKFSLTSLIKYPEAMQHIFMGFSICGQYFITMSEKIIEDNSSRLFMFFPSYEYELHLWKFVHGYPLQSICKYKIFKHLKEQALDMIYFMQFPLDPHKIVCYGVGSTAMAYVTILTLPSPKSCNHCVGNLSMGDETITQGWCQNHGFILHYVFSMSQPCPNFNPHISLAYPDHFVINTGHYIHILNVSTMDPPASNINMALPNMPKEEFVPKPQSRASSYVYVSDAEYSASPFSYENMEQSNSIVDAILEDFSEYDLESGEFNKPFHELNISCEPLNVTGKSYHNTLVQNIVDPRIKRLQQKADYAFPMPQTSKNSAEKSNIDIKNAEKQYEFTEENEKCEKLSSFRKKRLAEKKYEFSEDNSENIVPFNSLRRERRFFIPRASPRCIRSPDLSWFLSPRSPSMRSPMQSPSSRSPCGASMRAAPYSLRNSPHHSKSPISPRDHSARKLYVYSPSIDSDCSDSDSRLVLKMGLNQTELRTSNNQQHGLLIVDPARETPRWIRKVVRRFSNGDFETSSLLSGQSRDDYNIPIEIPLIAQTLNEQHLEVVPDFKIDHVTQMQLIVTQRSFDCEQFFQRKAEQLCADAQLEFTHTEDYDIKLVHVCPINGHIICKAVIKIGALKCLPYVKPETYITQFYYSWNIVSDDFKVIDSPEKYRLQPACGFKPLPSIYFPKTNCRKVLVMDYYESATKTVLRDYNNLYEVCFGDHSMRHHPLLLRDF